MLAAAPLYDCGSKQRLGAFNDGGKWVCVNGALQEKACVVYSLGSHMQVDTLCLCHRPASTREAQTLVRLLQTDFEEDILRKSKCQVFTFDYSLSDENGRALNSISPRMHFHPYKIGAKKSHNASTQHQEKSVAEIMKELDHTSLAILKMDIEEGEWEVLEELIHADEFPFMQLQVEFHAMNVSLKRMLNVFSSLTQAGYRVFSVEPNLYCECCSGKVIEYSFIKVNYGGKA